ncbi:MAG: efflux RND transporter periplasmic adaptor subunit [Taibaiella sp.]|nr:efflux RND transporter periplasmic adaptor subunit [Taibaiella sp.]
MKYIFPVAALTAITALSACSHTEKKTAKAVATTHYDLITLTPHQVNGSVRLPGVMQPFQFVQLYPKVSGFVKAITVDRGSIVHKGQVLLRLQAPEIEEQVSAAKLKYTEAHAQYLMSMDRYQRLKETSNTPGTVSPYDLSSARSKMMGDSATAQGQYANYNAQRDMYSYLTVTAPFDGVITERNVHPGALLGPGMQNAKPMLVLQQQSKLRLIVNIPEQYSAQVNNGDAVHYTVNALPGRDFGGTIARAAGALSNSFRSETIEVDVPNTTGILKAGMYAEVVLPIKGSATAFALPASTVITTTERKYVVAVNNGQAKYMDVTIGNQQGDTVEVFGTLEKNTQIIRNPTYQIKDGSIIK